MSDTYRVKITLQAYDNISKIIRYISHNLHSPDAASQLLDRIYEKAASLAHMPKRIALINEEPWGSKGIRKVSVNNFYIYFWIDEKNMMVQIISVIYSKRNQIQQLGNILSDPGNE